MKVEAEFNVRIFKYDKAAEKFLNWFNQTLSATSPGIAACYEISLVESTDDNGRPCVQLEVFAYVPSLNIDALEALYEIRLGELEVDAKPQISL